MTINNVDGVVLSTIGKEIINEEHNMHLNSNSLFWEKFGGETSESVGL